MTRIDSSAPYQATDISSWLGFVAPSGAVRGRAACSAIIPSRDPSACSRGWAGLAIGRLTTAAELSRARPARSTGCGGVCGWRKSRCWRVWSKCSVLSIKELAQQAEDQLCFLSINSNFASSALRTPTAAAASPAPGLRAVFSSSGPSRLPRLVSISFSLWSSLVTTLSSLNRLRFPAEAEGFRLGRRPLL